MQIRLTPLALIPLLALAACGGGSTSTTPAAVAPSSAAPLMSSPASSPPASASTGDQPLDQPVVGTGMKGGCDALDKVFIAIGGGDSEQVKRYRLKAIELFDDVAATAATDLKTAKDGAKLASALEFMPADAQSASTSDLATDYRNICVAKYGAPARP